MEDKESNSAVETFAGAILVVTDGFHKSTRNGSGIDQLIVGSV
jgi:hypothetical protein